MHPLEATCTSLDCHQAAMATAIQSCTSNATGGTATKGNCRAAERTRNE